MKRATVALAGGVMFAGALRAHEADAATAAPWWTVWTWEPGTVATLFVMGALYWSGLRALRRATGRSGKLRREATMYGCGWVLLCVALLSPVHPWGSRLFSVHMTQHELLMVAAAPLIILGRPAVVLLFALPRGAARGGLAGARRWGAGGVWRWAGNPLVAWLVHAVALWIWHVPVLFEATLDNEWVHAAQHVSFFGTALLFWQAVFYGPWRRTGYGLAVLNLFTTALHTGALGALLTFASRLWYPAYAARAAEAGFAPLEDQQLGGLLMWIPAGLVYVVAGLALFAGWLRESERRSELRLNSTLSCARSSSL